MSSLVTNESSFKTVTDVKLTILPENKVIDIKELYQNLKKNQLLHCHLFLRGLCPLCRIGVVDTSIAIKEVNQKYNDIFKSVYICITDRGMDDFLKNNFITPNIVYIDHQNKMYKSLKFNRPSLFECFGFCDKRVRLNKEFYEKKYPNITGVFKLYKFNPRLGGSILVNNKGKIIFSYSMKFIGNHCNPEDLIMHGKTYLGIIDLYKTIEQIGNDQSNIKLNESKQKEIMEENDSKSTEIKSKPEDKEEENSKEKEYSEDRML